MNKKTSNGQLFLSGGGNEEDSRLIDEYFLSALPNKKILYVPIAMTKTFSFEQCYDWITSTLPNCSRDDVWIDMATKLDMVSFSDLFSYDAVYLGGGNTFYLLDTLRKTGFDQKLKEFFLAGRCIYGGSAGAIVLGGSIETASFFDSNDPKIERLDGLGLVQNYLIWPHYEPVHDLLVERLSARNSKMSIIAMPERGGVRIFDEKIESIGRDSSYIFHKSIKKRIT